jgi:hypothetical protein
VLGDGQRPGTDVTLEHGRSFVNLDRARMYSMVANESVMPGALQLKMLDAGISAYAFTFISCPVS